MAASAACQADSLGNCQQAELEACWEVCWRERVAAAEIEAAVVAVVVEREESALTRW